MRLMLEFLESLRDGKPDLQWLIQHASSVSVVRALHDLWYSEPEDHDDSPLWDHRTNAGTLTRFLTTVGVPRPLIVRASARAVLPELPRRIPNNARFAKNLIKQLALWNGDTQWLATACKEISENLHGSDKLVHLNLYLLAAHLLDLAAHKHDDVIAEGIYSVACKFHTDFNSRGMLVDPSTRIDRRCTRLLQSRIPWSCIEQRIHEIGWA